MLQKKFSLRNAVRGSRWPLAAILLLSVTAFVHSQDVPEGQIEKEIAIKAGELQLGKPLSGIRRTAVPQRNTAWGLPPMTVWWQEFTDGRVYWIPRFRAFGIKGDILARWIAEGGENGFGFPLSDEAPCELQGGRAQGFEYGVFYWRASNREITIRRINSPVDFSSLPRCQAATTPAPIDEVGRFRVILTGFTVNRQTSDNILESDGKGDEVFIVAEVAQFDNSQFYYRQTGTRHEVPYFGYWLTEEGLNGRGNITLRRSLTSIIMGDANNQEMPRIRAGSAGDMGGLRTGDSFPTKESWKLTVTPSANRLPMLLWEGDLRQPDDLVIIIPTIWEWDDGSLRARADFTEEANKYFQAYTQRNQGFASRNFGYRDISGAGDRPIGWQEVPRSIRLNRAAAFEAAFDSRAGHGRGVHEITYFDYDRTESYTLYFKIERLR